MNEYYCNIANFFVYVRANKLFIDQFALEIDLDFSFTELFVNLNVIYFPL